MAGDRQQVTSSLDPAQGLEMHGTNGAVVQLPYELWEVVKSQLCSVESTRETGDLQRWKQLNASVLNSVGHWDV